MQLRGDSTCQCNSQPQTLINMWSTHTNGIDVAGERSDTASGSPSNLIARHSHTEMDPLPGADVGKPEEAASKTDQEGIQWKPGALCSL